VQRIFGAIAIFIGWLSLGLGIMAGLVESQSFGLNHKEGGLPLLDVYGITGAVILWIFVGAALLLAVPMASAMVAPDPRRKLRVLAVGMAVGGLVLLPDQLGRFFGLPVMAGAVSVWVGGEFIHRETAEAPGMTGPAEAYMAAEDPTADHAPAVPAPKAATPPAQVAPPVPTITSTGASGRRSSRRKASDPERLCPWCSTVVPAKATTCRSCQAILDTEPGDAVAIAGVTEVSPALQQYAEKVRAGKGRTSLLSMIFSDPPVAPVTNSPAPSDADALRPPSAALKAEMARLDAEIAAGTVTLGPSDETVPPTE
jgi:hypothetical protein